MSITNNIINNINSYNITNNIISNNNIVTVFRLRWWWIAVFPDAE